MTKLGSLGFAAALLGAALIRTAVAQTDPGDHSADGPGPATPAGGVPASVGAWGDMGLYNGAQARPRTGQIDLPVREAGSNPAIRLSIAHGVGLPASSLIFSSVASNGPPVSTAMPIAGPVTGGAEMHAGAFGPLRAAAHWIAALFEASGVLAIVLTAAGATLRACGTWARGGHDVLSVYRADLGRGVLLGLEFLVAADIIGMVTITPGFNSLGVLGLIILIRTFLSLSLNVEIEGRWPWRRSMTARPANE